jgi:hypothetical protein
MASSTAVVRDGKGGDSGVEERALEFAFPFEPYSIQRDFMQTLYHSLEAGSVGIFESPVCRLIIYHMCCWFES